MVEIIRYGWMRKSDLSPTLPNNGSYVWLDGKEQMVLRSNYKYI